MATTFSKTKEARQLYDQYMELSEGFDFIWWQKAERLYRLHKNSLYKYVFGTDEDDVKIAFRHFCEQIDIPPTTAYYMISTYKKWIVELGYNISDMLPYVTKKLNRAAAPKYNIKKKDASDVLAHSLPVSKGGLAWTPQTGRTDYVDYLEDNFT